LSENKKQRGILVVDDDPTIRETLQAILEQEGYSVETAENGAQAIKKSNAKLFDLAVVDMRLPDMMGTDLLSRLRETTPKMQKIILTGYPSMENAIDSVNEGADCYILKPVDAEVVLLSIEDRLRKRDEEARYSEQKVKEFIETRARGIDKSNRGVRSD
jgi:DNA-binding NtrC family response regulator